jgi:hypothetical protein
MSDAFVSLLLIVFLIDFHSKSTFRRKLSSVQFEGSGRIGLIFFFQIYVTRNLTYKLFLVEYNKLLSFNKRFTTF